MGKDKLHELVDALPETQVETVGTFIEFILEKVNHRQDNDLDILNRNAEYLNSEAEDVLTYQVNL